MKIKLVSTLVTSTCLVFALASCSDKDISKDEATTNETTSQFEKIRIAAAANLSDVLPQIVEGYRAEHNVAEQDIELTFASSGKLYAQMIAGAPYDIYLSANQEFPAKWVNERATNVPENQPFTYTQGQLSFYSVTKAVGKLNQTTLAELLAKQSDAKITIANPELAPYGASAKAYLQGQKVYDLLNDQKRLIQAENIGQAFQYANTGSVDYGFVAQSQVTAIKATPEQFYTLPEDAYPAILQDGIVLSDAALATDFTSYLLSPAGQRYFADAGYLAIK
ncbi:MAG: molybdate ABC transporter substrate-binding protein [Psychrobacter sp.]|nr:molybdate ABC transporter substrate-binding protein [Psychrobacter sp.]